MRCPRCGNTVLIFGNEWECDRCGNYGSFLTPYDDDHEEEDRIDRAEYLKLIDERHSVRSYLDRKLEPELADRIELEIEKYNRKSGLHIRLVEGAEGVLGAVTSKLAGWKKPPAAYLVMAGKAEKPDLEESCGYYGEYLVLFLQSLGLNTCWVGMFNKKVAAAQVAGDERVAIVIAVGYGETQGAPHKSKPLEKLTDVKEMPDWFRSGLECARKAPTAINQQKFFITLEDGVPKIEIAGKGPFTRIDLGIVRCHFEIGSQH